MLKNRPVNQSKAAVEEDFDWLDYLDSGEGEIMAEILSGMIAAANHQQMVAMELTQLIIEKGAVDGLNEEKIGAVFKRANAVVAASFPLKALWEKFN